MSENWIDLSNVPKKNGIGKNKDKLVYDWEHSIGCVCRFNYNNVSNEFKILKYNKVNKEIDVLYMYNTLSLKTDSVIKCQLNKLINNIARGDYLYNIGDIINDGCKKFKILKRERRNRAINPNTSQKYYYCECQKCKGSFWRNEYNLKERNQKCPVCKNISVVEGINDIPTTDSWMIPYFKGGVEVARKYTHGSSKREYFICPFCNTEKDKPLQIKQIYDQHGVSCPVCSDGMSYPNKFMYSFFKQLNVDFEIEKIFDWSNYIYDDYVVYNGLKIICENHGKQHYEENYFSKKYVKRTFEEEKQNDIRKKECALSNGINIYIELDCRESNKIWIKNSILKSTLNGLFDISKVNFEVCDEFATSNLVKAVCEYKNQNPVLFSTELATIFGLSSSTISHYLNKGNELGWCDYDGLHEAGRRNSFLSQQRNSKPLLCNETGQAFFNRKILQEMSENVIGIHIDGRSAQSVARGIYKQIKGFTFKYISKSEFNRIKQVTPELAFGDFFTLEEEVA